jgi:hypothetical protein
LLNLFSYYFGKSAIFFLLEDMLVLQTSIGGGSFSLSNRVNYNIQCYESIVLFCFSLAS